jgi:outer membrane autotransporter protein
VASKSVCVCLGLAALLATAALSSGTALAACTPGAPSPGAAVVCAGPSTGVGTGIENDVSVTVRSGATVSRAPVFAVIDLADRALVDNAGTVQATTGQSAILVGVDSTIGNTGRIVAPDGMGVFADAGSTVTNSGTILAGPGWAGVAFLGNGTSLVNSGSITGGGAGVISLGGTLDNSGVIRATDGAAGGVGILTTGVNTIRNSGLVEGGDAGVGISGASGNLILNSGTIRARNGGNSLFLLGGGNAVDNSGTLDGTLIVIGAGNLVQNRGVITITDPLGTAQAHQIQGDFTQTSAGTLVLRSNAAGTVHDTFDVSGTARLGGTLAVALPKAYYGGAPRPLGTVLTAGTVTGGFDRTVTNSPFINPVLAGAAGTLSATLVRTPFDAAPTGGANGRAVGAVLERNYVPGLGDKLSAFYWDVLTSPSPTVLNQLTGQGIVDAQQVGLNANARFLEGSTSAARAWLEAGHFSRDGAGIAFSAQTAAAAGMAPLSSTAATAESPWRLWASVYGSGSSLQGSAARGTSPVNASLGGLEAGIGYEISDSVFAGVSAGAGRSSWTVSELATNGSLDSAHAGAFVAGRWGDFYAIASLAYGHLDGDTDRTVLGIGSAQSYRSSLSGHVLSGRLEAGWRYVVAGYGVTPFLAVEPARVDLGTAAEAGIGGPGDLALTLSSLNATSVPVTAGVRVDTSIDLGNGYVLSPYASLGWLHETSPSRRGIAVLSLFPGQGFGVAGAAVPQDSVRLAGGFGLAVGPGVSLGADLDALMSDGGSSFAGSGRLNVRW